MKQRVILLMQFYDPEPIYKGQHFAECLAAQGYQIEVVTGFPNYPGGKIYPGYRIKPLQKTEINGIKITRLALFPSHSTSRLGRAFNYLSFAVSAFIYLAFAAQRADLVYVYHPPVSVGLAAVTSQVLRGTPVLLDIHDLWPDTLVATCILRKGFAVKLIGFACRWLYRRSAHIIVQSKGFKQALISRGVPDSKITTVIGWTDERYEKPAQQAKPLGFPDKPGFYVLFAGNIGPAQALDSILDAAHHLKQHNAPSRITFIILGEGLSLPNLKNRAAAAHLDNVVFIDRVRKHEVALYFAAADCLLVHLRNDPLFEITIPSKTQAYLFAEKPILMAVNGEANDLVTSANGGITARPEDPASIASACLKLSSLPRSELNKMGTAGRKYYEKHLSMDAGIKAYHAAFQQTINS